MWHLCWEICIMCHPNECPISLCLQCWWISGPFWHPAFTGFGGQSCFCFPPLCPLQLLDQKSHHQNKPTPSGSNCQPLYGWMFSDRKFTPLWYVFICYSLQIWIERFQQKGWTVYEELHTTWIKSLGKPVIDQELLCVLVLIQNFR